MHSLHGRRRVLGHFSARARGPGEGDHVDFPVRRQWCADIWTIAIDEIEDARRHAGLVHDLGPDDGAERRVFRRLEHHGAAGSERRHDLGRHLIHRPVPRRDQCTNAHRLLHQSHRAAHFLELESFQHIDHGADVPDADPRLRAFRQRHGCAHFYGHGLCYFVVVSLIGSQNPFHECEALGGRRARIAVECAPRRHHRPVDIFAASHGYDAGNFLGSRIDDLQFLRLDRIHPRAIDVELPIVIFHCKAPSKCGYLIARILPRWEGAAQVGLRRPHPLGPDLA